MSRPDLPSEAAPPTPSRYIIGIDLGTTNCALAYIDSRAADQSARVLEIPQWESDGAIVRATTLPSFYYLPPKAEWKRGQLAWPGTKTPDEASGAAEAEAPDYAVGRLARLKSGQAPGRVIHAAKSWLCHAGVDRTARILPWHVGELVGDERRSPVEVSAAYLAHLRRTWGEAMQGEADARFDDQDVVLAVPASFDEVAQRLTLEAAVLAGFNKERVRLLEEPQAAFYHWLSSEQGQAQQRSLHGSVLICDIGGGTSDFSLLAVESRPDQEPALSRTAVSDHLLLGGDNIDLSLAHRFEERLVGAGKRLSSRQWAQLVFATRRIKEQALRGEGAAADELHVSIAGEGASLFATAMTASLTQAEISEQILGGFFPDAARDAEPHRARSALMQLGLPYAQDSALTKHLAGFLRGRQVDAVLYTGGTLKPVLLRERLTQQLSAWQGQSPRVLDNDAMDLAVALGAAAYGLGRRQAQGRIRSGYARSLYLEVGQSGSTLSEGALLCIVPQGYDGLAPLNIDSLGLKLRTGHPVRFQMLSSNRRPQDRLGDLVPPAADEFHLLPPLDTRLEAQTNGESKLIDVSLTATLAETGLFHLYCVHRAAGGAQQRWQLDFNVRAGAPVRRSEGSAAPAPAVDAGAVKAASELLSAFYGKKKPGSLDTAPPKTLLRDLENLIDQPREAWTTAFLRSLWPVLAPGLTRRNRSVAHESGWLYLAGYALRPGYGYELDEWRIAELWRCFELGLAFPKERQVEEQWWLMWRRVAGGLQKAQQERIFDRIFPVLRKNEATSAELYMLAGSLERIDMGQKIRLGQQLVQQISGGRQQFINQRIWALARIASRVPLYGGAEAICRPEVVTKWFHELRSLKRQDPAYAKLPLFLAQAGRLVMDREFDLTQPVREEFLQVLAQSGATAEQVHVVREFVPVDHAARTQLFGESLPAGLVLS